MEKKDRSLSEQYSKKLNLKDEVTHYELQNLEFASAIKINELLSDPRNVPLWFGTNRKPVNLQNLKECLTTNWSETTTLGRCIVNVPKGHKPGETGSSWWVRLIKGDDRLNIISIESLPEFWANLSNEMLSLKIKASQMKHCFFYMVLMSLLKMPQ